ncbi:MAG: hypothetical protein H5T42_08275 [Methanothrix sp.]|uniref:Uncharacterized protein n=1 Tax=Methanothrix thermoacetophila (strain DSM 6194 / JCM 14653 / NBRC 101360 / PT) TaxID=349307 RepID=A0B8H8_METTP|nr:MULTISPECIES: hypothetical protein [Methanothrix]ABK15002.1 hypothetical protein Mthe_1223 [Methanothrix thermoacetophila PT]MBC7080443.1 hypothetical protein [Methanothrix sp.]NPU86910.1 hypothetical protein [Methanothrix sp.]
MRYTILLAVLLMLVSICMAGAIDVIHLSTLDETEAVSLPMISQYTPAISNVSPDVVQLSTLGKKIQRSTVEPKELSAAKPVTITPSFAIMNANITAGTNTIITMPQALSGAQINYLRPNVTVWTPPIAIFGGA